MKERGDALMHVYIWEHAWSAFTTEPLDRCLWNLIGMKFLLPAHVFRLFIRSALGWIQGRARWSQREIQREKALLQYLECCLSGSGFGQIFQGVDPGRGKKMVEEGLLLWRNPPSDQMFTVTYWCIADNTVDTCIYLNPVILVVFFSDWTVCCWLSGER